MSRASKAITLVLMGSAAGLFGYNALHRSPSPSESPEAGRAEDGDFDPSDDSVDSDGDATTRPAGSSHSTGSHGSHSGSSGFYARHSGGSSRDYNRNSSPGSSGSSGSSAGQGPTPRAAASAAPATPRRDRKIVMTTLVGRRAA